MIDMVQSPLIHAVERLRYQKMVLEVMKSSPVLLRHASVVKLLTLYDSEILG